MIFYFDTSALVKLYVSEPGSATTRRCALRAKALATSVVAYAEARAAFARLLRTGASTQRHHDRRLRGFNADWADYMRIELTPEVARNAGDVAELYALRGFDAIHLASVLWLKERTAADLGFAVFDRRLRGAVSRAGLPVFPRNLSRRRG